jgi:hemoglobin
VNDKLPEITEAAIETMVRTFYGKARQDPLIGPVFENAVHDWEAHFPTMFAFWSSVLLGTRGYDGRPMPVHMRLPIEAPMFDRWLMLWSETAAELFAPGPAVLLRTKAETIARSLKLGLFFRPEQPAG